MTTRSKLPSPARAKSTIMAVALAFVGVFEFVECIENGDGKFKAAKKAVRRTHLRGKAIKKAAREVAPEIRRVDEEEDAE